MLKTLRNALRVEEIRKRLLYTFLIILVVRFGSQLPIPGVDREYLANVFKNSTIDAFNFFDAMTGGSFANCSVFALSITPYINASIIMQLLTIAIPKLEEIQKDGEEGKKKINKWSRWMTVALALIEATAMAIGFGNSMIVDYTWYNVIVVVLTMVGGSAFLMWLGEQGTEKGIGSGISLILLVNILARIPDDFATLYYAFVSGKNILLALLAVIIILAVIIGMIMFVVLLSDGVRKVPVQYAKRIQGRRTVGGQTSNIPIKVNTAGVIPVIFASSLMSFPAIIAQFFDVSNETVGGKILIALQSSSWCRFTADAWYYSFGLIVYVVLIVAFAYFYTSVSFNPTEIAENMKKQGGFVPGIRPGKPTAEYLNHILNYLVFFGAAGLIVVALIPIVVSGVFSIGSISFGGTSLIIIVGVVMEDLKQIESKMLVRYYKGFLND
ncbi:MAG: preprotein translocase subunit SecY [Lachnospiraceae bacterium]|nr:preprotein translocase subunit SecY [Lachnospiraceae bacterium]